VNITFYILDTREYGGATRIVPYKRYPMNSHKSTISFI